MKLIEYYIRAFVVFAYGKPHQSVMITRSSLSEELGCSERNIIHILNKMEEEGWIERTRGKGRGNISTIIFLKSLEEMFLYYGKQTPKLNDIERLLVQLENAQLVEDIDSNTLLNSLFGIHQSPNRNGDDGYESLTMPYFRPIYSLDPAYVERQTERHLVQQLFNTLVIYDQEHQKLEPSISHYWEVDPSGKGWTFYLRKGVKFHNGEHLRAEDVKFSFERLKDTPSKWLVKNLKNIVCHGAYIIEFEFFEPNFTWAYLLSSPKFSIIPMNYGNASDFSMVPVGTGPYKVQTRDENSLTLTVHEHYFSVRPHIDEIRILILPSIEKYFNMEEKVAYLPFTLNDYGQLPYKYVEKNNLAVRFMMWNMKKQGIRENHELRRKVNSIIDRGKLVKDLGFPRFEPVNSFLKQVPTIRNEQNEIEEPTPFKEKIRILTYEMPPNRDDLEWFQQQCALNGIEVDISIVPYESFITEIAKADLVLSEYITEEVEEVALYNLYQTKMGVIQHLLSERDLEQIDEFIRAAMMEEQPVQRIQKLDQIERDLIDRQIVLPLYSTYQRARHHGELMGISLSTLGLMPFNELFYRGSFRKINCHLNTL